VAIACGGVVGDAWMTTKVRRQHQSCIVAVWVGDQIKGTGFLVAPRVIVTCAHVLHPHVESLPADQIDQNTLSVSFLTDLSQKLEVDLECDHFSPQCEDDIAFLVLKQDPPAGVAPATLCYREDLYNCEIDILGFAKTAPYNCQSASGVIKGDAYTSHDRVDWLLDNANSVKDGHSGAPCFDQRHHQVMGMACKTPRCTATRQADVAYAICCKAIRDLWPELFKLVHDEELESKLTSARELLCSKMLKHLRQSATAKRAIETKLAEIDSGEGIDTNQGPVNLDEGYDDESLVNILVALPLGKCSPMLQSIWLELDSEQPRDWRALRAVAGIYLSYAPMTLMENVRDKVKVVVANIRRLKSDETIILPIADETVLEVFMAALDGREVDFDPGSPLFGRGLLGAPPPEWGILAKSTAVAGEATERKPRATEDQYLRSLIDHVWQDSARWHKRLNPKKSQSLEVDLHALNLFLEDQHRLGRTRYMLDLKEQKQISPQVIARIRDRLTHLAVVTLDPDSKLGMDVVNPFRSDTFLLPPDAPFT
jgi:hypothetical protein